MSDTADQSWEPVDELQQSDIDVDPIGNNYKPVGVVLEGIARVRDLPARRMACDNRIIAKDGVPVRLVGAQDQRQSIIITTALAGVYISSNAGVVLIDAVTGRLSGGSYLASGQSRTYEYTGEIFVTCAAIEAAAAQVSYDSFFTED